jgi:phage-related minor tail protein
LDFDTEAASIPITFEADTRGLVAGLDEAERAGKRFSASLATAFEGLIFRGKSLGEVVRSLGLSLSQMALRAAFKPLESALSGLFSGLLGGGGGLPIPFAKGGVIAAPAQFPLPSGGVGLAGERGAEAVMPLTRGPDGRLGVAAVGGGSPIQITFAVSTPDVEGFQRSEAQIAAMLSRAVGRGQRNL